MYYFPCVRGKYLFNGTQPCLFNWGASHLINVFGADEGDLQLLVGVVLTVDEAKVYDSTSLSRELEIDVLVVTSKHFLEHNYFSYFSYRSDL